MQLNRAIVSSSLLTTHVYNRAADICSPRMCMHMEIVEDITRILRVLVEEFERWRFNFRRAWVRRLKALWRMRNSLKFCSVLHDINLIVGCWHDDGFSYFFLFVFLKNAFDEIRLTKTTSFLAIHETKEILKILCSQSTNCHECWQGKVSVH